MQFVAAASVALAGSLVAIADGGQRLAADGEHHLAYLGELDGVAEQVDQDLAQTSHVAHDGLRRVFGHHVGQIQPFLRGFA